MVRTRDHRPRSNDLAKIRQIADVTVWRTMTATPIDRLR
jgi:hypothetical protein